MRGSRASAPRDGRRPPAVTRVLGQLVKTARRHEMFQASDVVLVAVSGGPDSICLLHSLVRVRRLLRIEPICFHFDHALREGSERDAVYVRGQAGRAGVPFVLRRASSRPSRGESVEAWARTARYEALAEIMRERGAAKAATGHTADDQAETVLLAMLRGGGLDSVSAMSPVRGVIVRPLIDVTREETVEFCRALSLRPRRDPMNDDPSFMRVAVRARVIPSVERALGRNVRASLVRTASLLREDAMLLDRLADDAARTIVVGPAASASRAAGGRSGTKTPAEVALRARALRDAPIPIASRVIRRSIRDLGVVAEAAHVEAVRSLASGRPGRRASLPGGLVARRDREYVRVSRRGGGARVDAN